MAGLIEPGDACQLNLNLNLNLNLPLSAALRRLRSALAVLLSSPLLASPLPWPPLAVRDIYDHDN